MVGHEKRKNIIISFIYASALFYMVFKASFYYHEIDWGPDARAHLSYMYYEWENPKQLIPEFEHIYMLDLDIVGEKAYIVGKTEDVCYLGHPPAYYKLMSACGAVCYGPQGRTYIDMRRVHICNVLLTMAGILMCLQWGGRYIQRKGNHPGIHFLYAAIVSTLPMISYIGSNISNDNILYLDVALVLWGLQRGVEGKRNWATYFLIALGTVLSVLSKLTLGLIVVVGLAIVVLYLMFKERSGRIVFCKEFAFTLPLYFVALAYFLVLRGYYHTLQPSFQMLSPESFARSGWALLHGDQRSMWQSIQHFWKGFWMTWTAIYGHAYCMSRQGKLAALPYYIFIVIFMCYIVGGIVRGIRRKLMPEELPMIGLGIGSIVAFIYQIRSQMPSYMAGGDGGYQARYYICGIAVYALCCVQPLVWVRRRKERWVSMALTAVAVIYGAMLIYSDFYYFLMNFEAYREFI